MDLCKVFEVEEGQEFSIVEEGQEFSIRGIVSTYKVEKIENIQHLLYLDRGRWQKSKFWVNDLVDIEIVRRKELTEEEKIILKNIDKKFKYIARDEDGTLFFYTSEPSKGCYRWHVQLVNGIYARMPTNNSIFQNIKWEDDIPVKIDDYVERGGLD